MPKVKMVALDRMRYGTRRLLAGDTFEAPAAEARVWTALKKAKEAPLRPPAALSKPPAALVKKVPKKNEEPQPVAEQPDEVAAVIAEADTLAATREEYQVKLGKRPFHGWDVEELRRRISEAE